MNTKSEERERAAAKAKALEQAHALAIKLRDELQGTFPQYKVSLAEEKGWDKTTSLWTVRVKDGEAQQSVQFEARNAHGYLLRNHVLVVATAGTYQRNGRYYRPSYEHNKAGVFPMERIVREVGAAMEQYKAERKRQRERSALNAKAEAIVAEVYEAVGVKREGYWTEIEAGPLRINLSASERNEGVPVLRLATKRDFKNAAEIIAFIKALREIPVEKDNA